MVSAIETVGRVILSDIKTTWEVIRGIAQMVRENFDDRARAVDSSVYARTMADRHVGGKTKPASQIGDIEREGDHKGEIYGGIWSKDYGGDNRPIWFLVAPKVMDHYKAAAWAEGQGVSLPTRKQGEYLTTLKGKGGAFTEIVNRGNSYPAGFVWLAEPTDDGGGAWCQRFSNGNQYDSSRSYPLPILFVRR